MAGETRGRQKLSPEQKKQTKSFVLRPETCERIESLVKILGIPRGEIVERAIMAYKTEKVGTAAISPLEYSCQAKLDLIRKVLEEK